MPSKRKRQGSPKRAHAKTKQKPAAPTTELEPEPEEDNRTKEQYKTQAEEEERARRSTRFAFSEDFDPEPELERLVRTLNKRVDAISSLQLVREEFLNTIEEQGKVRAPLVGLSRALHWRVLHFPVDIVSFVMLVSRPPLSPISPYCDNVTGEVQSRTRAAPQIEEGASSPHGRHA